MTPDPKPFGLQAKSEEEIAGQRRSDVKLDVRYRRLTLISTGVGIGFVAWGVAAYFLALPYFLVSPEFMMGFGIVFLGAGFVGFSSDRSKS